MMDSIDIDTIEDSQAKCRCCFIKFEENNDKMLISDKHVEIFRNLINVELKLDLKFSPFICRNCDNRLRKTTEFVKIFGNIQENFNDFVDGVSNISEDVIFESNDFHDDGQINTQTATANTGLCMRMKSCFVRLERLDYNGIKRITTTTSKLKKPKKKISSKSRTRLPPLVANIFSCDLCEYRTSRKLNLAIHLDGKHSVKKNKCRTCNKVYDSKIKLNLHIRTVHNKERQTFECSLCSSKSCRYKDYKTLRAHVEKHHFKEKFKITWTCDICGEEFYSKKRLDNHINNVHVGPFKCFDNNCKTAFKGSQSRKNHYLFYHNQDIKEYERLKNREPIIRPFKCIAKSCEKRFKFKGDMTTHFRSHGKTITKKISKSKASKLKQMKNKVFSCDICGYQNERKNVIQNHLIDKHLNADLKFECKVCFKQLINARNLAKHMKEMHIKTSNYDTNECLICGSNIKSYRNLLMHIHKFHSKEKAKIQFICDLCGDFYYSKSRLENHIKSTHHHGYKCFDLKCSRTFADFYCRRRHYLIHHNSNQENIYHLERQEPDIKPHKCLESSCNKSFRQRNKMMAHYISHSKNYAITTSSNDFKSLSKTFFYCDMCDHKTAFKGNLYLHMNSKHKLEESKCKICKKVYKNSVRLKLHTKHMHMAKYNLQIDCLRCYRTFKKYHDLLYHMEVSHKDDQTKFRHSCDHCGIFYYSKEYLARHMNIEHTGPYKCFEKTCTKTFMTYMTRKSHYLFFHNSNIEEFSRLKKKESDFRPFKCLDLTCDRKFKIKKQMMRHYSRFHTSSE